MSISNTVLSTIAAPIYASTGNSVVSVMYFCNTDATATNFNLYAVPAGGIANNATQIYKEVQVAGSDTFVIDMEKLAMSDGDTLQCNTTTGGAMTATVSYVSL